MPCSLEDKYKKSSCDEQTDGQREDFIDRHRQKQVLIEEKLRLKNVNRKLQCILHFKKKNVDTIGKYMWIIFI